MLTSSRVWNLGDTSFRRKKALDDYLELLKVLERMNGDEFIWDNETQSEFHVQVLKETDLLKYDKIPGDLSQRARTMTNALNKVGLCDKDRVITKIGHDLIQLDEDGTFFEIDQLEKRLNISKKNILFLRQMLKLRVFNSTEEESFNPFLIMLAFFTEYDYLEDEHFKLIVQNLYFNQDYRKALKEYQFVRNGEVTFEEYLKDNFVKDLEEVGDDESFLKFKKNDTHFRDIFINRKTPESVDLYEDFYISLKEVRKDISNDVFNEDNIKTLLLLLRRSEVKTVFTTNEIFDIPSVSGRDAINFFENNKDNELFKLSDERFRGKLYSVFVVAKNNTLIKEYHDVTRRIFNLTGIIDFSNGRVRISKKYFNDLVKTNNEILLELIEEKKYKNIKEYYEAFYNNEEASLETLNIDIEVLTAHNNKIMKEVNIQDVEKLDDYYLNLEEKEFIEFIDKKFPNELIIELLENIKVRNDDFVYDNVTDSAPIPTIFEYIIGIAWYRISLEYEKYNLLESLNLSLDGSFLPLSHAVGGDGDIVINYENHILMLEVTLMNLNNQRRAELEPVIRHTTNLSISNPSKPVYTLFIANDIDYNVSTIFRICSFVNLKTTIGKEEYTENGVSISSLKIDEVITILREKIQYEDIYDSLVEEFKHDRQNIITKDWRENLLGKVL